MDKSSDELQLTVHNMKEIMHEFNDRVTDDAARRIALEEQDRVQKVARLSKVMARHAGRKTIKEEDVRQVYQMEEEL